MTRKMKDLIKEMERLKELLMGESLYKTRKELKIELALIKKRIKEND